MRCKIKKFKLECFFGLKDSNNLYKCFIKRTNSFKGNWQARIIHIRTNKIKKALDYICRKSKNMKDIKQFDNVKFI